ncbi:MAG: NAD(P)-dependent alcohol dehydrogenase [Sphingomonas sp.]
MWAYEYSEAIGLDHLRKVERPDPTPGHHQILLRMRAFALNYRDLAIANGHYHVGVSPPLVPLSDGAGEVIEVGSAVTRFHLGDLACPTYLPAWISGPARAEIGQRRLGGPSDGVLAEYMCIDEAEAVRAPAHLDAAEAATLPVTAVTAWHQLYAVGCLSPGETLLVQGAGGVSTAALQLAQAGGTRVIALLRNEKHADRLRALGASAIVVADAKDWPQQITTFNGGVGADAVVNVAGGRTLNPCIAALRVGGRVHLVGYADDTNASLDIFTAIRHGVTIHIATAGNRDSFEAMVRAMEANAIHPPVAAAFPVAQFRDALDYLARGGHLGKVLLMD